MMNELVKKLNMIIKSYYIMSLINYCFSNVFKQNIEKENLALEGETPNGVPEIRVKKPSFDIVYDGNHTRISSYFNDSITRAAFSMDSFFLFMVYTKSFTYYSIYI